MRKESLFNIFFKLTSIVTDFFPKSGAHFLDFVFLNILGNKLLIWFLSKQAELRISKIKEFNKILVVSDLNIGDSVICSSGVTAFRKIFPKAEIDYVVKKSAVKLLSGNQDISNLYGLFVGAPYPNENDLKELSSLAESKRYDCIINYSPMINDKIFGEKNVINYSLMVAGLVKNEKNKQSINSISYKAYEFIMNLFGSNLTLNSKEKFTGPKVFLSDEAVKKAEEFLHSNNVFFNLPIIMFNPETTAKFTRIPLTTQIEILNKLLNYQCQILLGSSRVEKGIELKLFNSLPEFKKNKIIIIPDSFKLDAFTALIDFSDIFITGDTGPLHLAAARKYLNNNKSLRNKTAVFSIFGSTPSRMYGFDSKTTGFFAANQDAPSRAFISKTPCRNITCINKLAKTCKEVRCFNGLDVDEIISESVQYLKSIGKHLAVLDSNSYISR